MTVRVGSTTLDRFTNLDKASGFDRYSYDVSNYAGETVKVTFSGKRTQNPRRRSSSTTRHST